MAKKIGHVVLIGALLISGFHGMSIADWTSDLESSINQMTRNINAQVQSFTQGLQARIEDSVQRSIQPALQEVNKAIANLPRDAEGRIISTGGSSVIVNGGDGVVRWVISDHTSDGEPFTRDTEERRVGNILYHNEVFYRPKTNTTERICWKRDLATPGSKPEFLTDGECNNK